MHPREISPLSQRDRSPASNSGSPTPEPVCQPERIPSTSTYSVKPLPDRPKSFGDRWRRCWNRPFLNTWLPEVLALTLSASCLVAIIVVLNFYQSKSIPQIPFGLTLNAIISILATGSKSSLLLAVGGAIGQLKWCWFIDKKRTLENIQDFDDASRGPWGSFNLLFSIHFRSLASLGALVTLLTLAYDPFVQQVLIYPVREVQHKSNETATGQALTFTPNVNTPDFGNALYAGIWSDESTFERNPACPSGNCNWPAFRSIGWCSKCENVTTRITVDDCPFEDLFNVTVKKLSCNITLDDSSSVRFAWGNSTQTWEYSEFREKMHWLNETDLDILSQIVWPVSKSSNGNGTAYVGVENPAMVFAYASLWYLGESEDDIRATVHHAEQCALTPCARTYNISMKNGVTHADVLEENYGLSSLYRVPSRRNVHSPFQTDEIFCWQADPGNLTWHYVEDYELEGDRYGYTNPYLPTMAERWDNTTHSGFCSLYEYQDTIIDALRGTARLESAWDFPAGGDPTAWEFFQAYPYASSMEAPEYSSKSVQKIMTSNLTTVIGSIAASLTKLSLDLSNISVSGNITTTEVYVHAEWKWLVFPIVLEALGIVLILSTVLVSHFQKARLWKSSVMPLLYHGMDESVSKAVFVPQDVFQMEEMARETKVCLNGPSVDNRIVFAY